MLQFYRQALTSLICAFLASLLMGYIGLQATFLSASLLPAVNSDWLWTTKLSADGESGDGSQIQLLDEEVNLSFDFTLSNQKDYPYASANLEFVDDHGQRTLVDLSAFDALSFEVKCSPSNTLIASILTFSEEVTKLDKDLTYRPLERGFSCDRQWSKVDVDLTRLETPVWWFEWFNVDISHHPYKLDQVPRLGFGSTIQSPREEKASVLIHNITLTGRDPVKGYSALIFILLAWLVLGVWLFKSYTLALTRHLQQKVQKDRPLVAYQKLTIEPHRDKEKTAILQYMATEYADESISLDTMVKALGISRTKINEILKSELGYTFVTYLNKLRLTEAARLLSDKPESSVSEVAYSVGYKSASYFNKLFKEEYGCTPKAFRSVCLGDENES